MVPGEPAMRINIEIDDKLIREALRVSGLKTKRAAVEAGLKALIRLSRIPLNRQKKILDLAARFIGRAIWTKAEKAASFRDTLGLKTV